MTTSTDPVDAAEWPSFSQLDEQTADLATTVAEFVSELLVAGPMFVDIGGDRWVNPAHVVAVEPDVGPASASVVRLITGSVMFSALEPADLVGLLTTGPVVDDVLPDELRPGVSS